MSTTQEQLSVIDKAKEKFELVCNEAQSLQLFNNFGSAFVAAGVVKTLRDVLSDEVMKEVFMPLMNTRIGFLTDATGLGRKPKSLYSIAVVRDAIIEGVTIGLHPTGNQFNIIASKMYPTKEGYTFLLRKLNCKYYIMKGADKSAIESPYAEIPTTIHFDENGEKKTFTVTNIVKKDSYSTHDQLQGKAERKAKKTLYEYLTGHDLGDGDIDNGVENISHVDITVDQKKETLKKNSKKKDLNLM